MKCYECKDCSCNRELSKKLCYTVCLGFMSPFFDKVILKNKNVCHCFKPMEGVKNGAVENKKI